MAIVIYEAITWSPRSFSNPRANRLASTARIFTFHMKMAASPSLNSSAVIRTRGQSPQKGDCPRCKAKTVILDDWEVELLNTPLAAHLDERHRRVLSVDCSVPSHLLLVYSRRTVRTGRPCTRRTAPDALVGTMPMTMLACRRERTRRSV